MPPSSCSDAGLAGLARASVNAAVHGLSSAHEDLCPAPRPASWQRQACCFVTLYLCEGNQLRGCIGSQEAHQPLYRDVIDNARAAALQDPRFSPVRVAELPAIRIEVAVLSRPEAISFGTEEELLRHLQPGHHGLIIEQHGKRATFLPSVWKRLPEAQVFLDRLKQKADITERLRGDRCHAWRYCCTSEQEH